jgi:hypothetical protein
MAAMAKRNNTADSLLLLLQRQKEKENKKTTDDAVINPFIFSLFVAELTKLQNNMMQKLESDQAKF